MRGRVIYESRLELTRLLDADFDQDAMAVFAQPFLLSAMMDRWAACRPSPPGPAEVVPQGPARAADAARETALVVLAQLAHEKRDRGPRAGRPHGRGPLRLFSGPAAPNCPAG